MYFFFVVSAGGGGGGAYCVCVWVCVGAWAGSGSQVRASNSCVSRSSSCTVFLWVTAVSWLGAVGEFYIVARHTLDVRIVALVVVSCVWSSGHCLQ
jgi:hypothetical protein